MGFILMWIEALATALLFSMDALATKRSNAKRFANSRIFSILMTGLSVLLALLPLVLAAGGLLFSFSMSQRKLEPTWMFFTVSWAVALTVGELVVLIYGLRRKPGTTTPRCQTWAHKSLTLGFFCALGLLAITLWNVDSAVKERLAAVRTESSALMLSVAPIRIPDCQNAAIFYEKAFAALPDYKRWPGMHAAKWDCNFSRPDFDTSAPDFKDYLAHHRATLAYLHKAAALPGCYFEPGYGQMSSDMIMPELAKFRQCARVLAVDARAKAATGDLKNACADIAVLNKIASLQMRDQVMISFLVNCGIEGIAKKALEGMLTSSTPTAEESAALRIEMDELCSFRHAYQRTLIGEEAFGLTMFDAMFGSNETSVSDVAPQVVALGAPWRVFMAEVEIASYRKLMKGMRDAAEYSSAGMNDDAQKIIKSIEEIPKGLFTSLIVPFLPKALISASRADAQRELSLLALGMAAYRAKNGKYPEKLEELTPEFIPAIPLDPFDNQPLKMERRDAEILLYSVGADNKPLPQRITADDDERIFRLNGGTVGAQKSK